MGERVGQILKRGMSSVRAPRAWVLVAAVLAARIWPPSAPLLLAVGGFLLTRWMMPRVSADRGCLAVAQWSYFLRILLTYLLYHAAVHGWPLFREYQGHEGFWEFSDDAQAHHNLGLHMARAWKGQGASFPSIAFDNWWFVCYVAVVYSIFGPQPLTVSVLNAWFGTVIVGAGIALMQVWRLSAKRVRFGAALVAFWPSLLLWSSQPMKDPLVLALIMAGLAALVTLVDQQGGRTPTFVGLTALVGAVAFSLSVLRGYTGFAFVLTAVLLTGAFGLSTSLRGQFHLVIRCVIVAVAVLGASFGARQIDLQQIVKPSRQTQEAAAHEIRDTTVASWANPVLDATKPSPRGAGLSPRTGTAPTPMKAKEKVQAFLYEVTPQTVLDRRKGFVSTGGHSVIDSDRTVEGGLDALSYLPRALSLALLGPFPWQWFDTKGRTGVFRSFAAFESVLVYLLIIGAALRVRDLRRAWDPRAAPVLLFVILVAIPMAIVVANLGTLFRLRLQYLLPFVLLLCLADLPDVYRRLTERVWRWLVPGRSLPLRVVRDQRPSQ